MAFKGHFASSGVKIYEEDQRKCQINLANNENQYREILSCLDLPLVASILCKSAGIRTSRIGTIFIALQGSAIVNVLDTMQGI